MLEVRRVEVVGRGGSWGLISAAAFGVFVVFGVAEGADGIEGTREPHIVPRPWSSPKAANFSKPFSRPKIRPSIRPARAPSAMPWL